MKVTFNGQEKIIQVNQGVTELNVKSDIYSAWKLWLTQGNNACYLPAISAIGGDPISETTFLGTSFFLENDWKVRPYEGDHSLSVTGNLYTRDGSYPFIKTIGNYNVMISMNRSNIIDTLVTGGGGILDQAALVQAIWDKAVDQLNTNNSIGKFIKTIDEKVDDTQAIVTANSI